MIQSGIPASIAINYSELSEAVKISEFRKTVMNDKTLNDEQKKIIEKLCSR